MFGDPQRGWDNGVGSSAPGRSLWQLYGERENHSELEDAPAGIGARAQLQPAPPFGQAASSTGLQLSSMKKQELTPS